MRFSENRIFISLLTAVYLFVALFSQNFHHHGSGSFYKEFHFKKSERTLSESNNRADFSDCLSCHILYEGSALLSEKFLLNLLSEKIFEKEFSAYRRQFAGLQHFAFRLRGPPQDFIF